MSQKYTEDNMSITTIYFEALYIVYCDKYIFYAGSLPSNRINKLVHQVQKKRKIDFDYDLRLQLITNLTHKFINILFEYINLL